MQGSERGAAQPIISFGCWIDLYERPDFQGKLRRVFGPSTYFKLRKSARNWGIEVQSLMVGPGACVRCYGSAEGESAIWLRAGTQVTSLEALEGGSTVESLQLLDREPTTDEMGASSFAAAPGGQIGPDVEPVGGPSC